MHATYSRGPIHPNGRASTQLLSSPNRILGGISDPRMSLLFAHLIGREVTITTRRMALLSGLFHRTDYAKSGKFSLILRYAREIKSSKSTGSKENSSLSQIDRMPETRGGIVEEYTISSSDVLMIAASGIKPDVSHTNANFSLGGGRNRLQTDGEISQGSSGEGRKLRPFSDFSTGTGKNVAALAPLDASRRGKWDQFAVNEEKFGVKTSFDESQYTTKLNKNSEDYAQRERQAEQIAAEITAKSSRNIHIREERGQVVEGVDPEEQYGSVMRPSSLSRRVPQKENHKVLSYAAAVSGNRVSSSPPSKETKDNAKPPRVQKVESSAMNTLSESQKANSGATNSPRHFGQKNKKTKVIKEGLKHMSMVRRSALPGRTSPNHGLRSPTLGPVQDSSAVSTLNIEAQTPKIGPEDIKSFQEFKTNEVIREVVTKRQAITNELWKFKDSLDSREGRRTSANLKTKLSGEKKVEDNVQSSRPSRGTNAPSKLVLADTDVFHGSESKDAQVPDASLARSPTYAGVRIEQRKQTKPSSQDSESSLPSSRLPLRQDAGKAPEPALVADSPSVDEKGSSTRKASSKETVDSSEHSSPKETKKSNDSNTEQSTETLESSRKTSETKKSKFKFNPSAKVFTPSSKLNASASQPPLVQSQGQAVGPQQFPQVPMQPGIMMPPTYSPGPVQEFPAMPYGVPPMNMSYPAAPIPFGPPSVGISRAAPYPFYGGPARFPPGPPVSNGMPFSYGPQTTVIPNSFVQRGFPVSHYGFPPGQPFLPQQRMQQQIPPQHVPQAPQQQFIPPQMYNQPLPPQGHDRMGGGRGRGRTRSQHQRTNNNRGYYQQGQQQVSYQQSRPLPDAPHGQRVHSQHGGPSNRQNPYPNPSQSIPSVQSMAQGSEDARPSKMGSLSEQSAQRKNPSG